MSEIGAPMLRRGLRGINLTLFGIVAIAPIAAITMQGFVADFSAGAVLPAYLLAGIGVSLTALSFAAMAEVAPSAGSVHGYVGKAMGPVLGFFGAWAMLLDYVLLNSLLLVYGALYLNGAFPSVPVSAAALGFAAYALVVAYLGISWSARADLIMATAQGMMVLVIVILGAQILFAGGTGAPAPAPLVPDGADLHKIISGASVAIIAYIGFDAVSTLAEEVASPDVGRVVGWATLVSVLVMMGVFLGAGWVLTGLATTVTGLNPEEAGLQIVAAHMPALVLPLGVVIALALGLGANLTTVSGSARILLSLARDGHLPAPLARIHPRFRSPWVAVALVVAISAPVSLVALSYSDNLSGLVSFGALTGFLLVNLSVIGHYGIALRSERWLRHWLMPALGAAVVLYIMSGISPIARDLGIAWLTAGLVVWGIGRFRRGRVTLPSVR